MREIKPLLQSTTQLSDDRTRQLRDHYTPELDISETVREALGITPAYKEMMMKIAKKASVHYAWVGRKGLHSCPNRERCIELATMEVVYAQHLSRFTRPSMAVLDEQLDQVGPRDMVPIIAQEMKLAVQREPKYEKVYAVIVTDIIGKTFNIMPAVFSTIGVARAEAHRLRLDAIGGYNALFQIADLKSIWEEEWTL